MHKYINIFNDLLNHIFPLIITQTFDYQFDIEVENYVIAANRHLYQNEIDFLSSAFIVDEGRNQLKFDAQIQIETAKLHSIVVEYIFILMSYEEVSMRLSFYVMVF